MKTYLFLMTLLVGFMITHVMAESNRSPGQVLFIVAHKDFYFQEYDDPRKALEAAGYKVVVASTKPECVPHPDSGQGKSSGVIKTDVLLKDVKPSEYRALVFVGGWGASMYQPAFQGKYQNGEYQLSASDLKTVNDLVEAMAAESKTLGAICHGTASLAWCRVQGASPVKGRKVAGYQGGGPGYTLEGKVIGDNAQLTRWHIENNGGLWAEANSVGDPKTDTDDVIVDGNIVTAQNYNSAKAFGAALVRQLAH